MSSRKNGKTRKWVQDTLLSEIVEQGKLVEILQRGQEFDDFGKSPIHYLVEQPLTNHSQRILRALFKKFNRKGREMINRRTKDGLSPLHLAAMGNHVKTVRFLCENQASLTLTDFVGRNATELVVSQAVKKVFDEFGKKKKTKNDSSYSVKTKEKGKEEEKKKKKQSDSDGDTDTGLGGLFGGDDSEDYEKDEDTSEDGFLAMFGGEDGNSKGGTKELATFSGLYSKDETPRKGSTKSEEKIETPQKEEIEDDSSEDLGLGLFGGDSSDDDREEKTSTKKIEKEEVCSEESEDEDDNMGVLGLFQSDDNKETQNKEESSEDSDGDMGLGLFGGSSEDDEDVTKEETPPNPQNREDSDSDGDMGLGLFG